MPVTIGALRESAPHETRVSLVPEVADKFAQSGARVLLEPGAGDRANFPDSLYKKAEWADARSVLGTADVVLTVQPLTVDRQKNFLLSNFPTAIFYFCLFLGLFPTALLGVLLIFSYPL